jgi:hypothetical protein
MEENANTEKALRTEAGERLFGTDGGGGTETGETLYTLPHGQVRDLLTRRESGFWQAEVLVMVMSWVGN